MFDTAHQPGVVLHMYCCSSGKRGVGGGGSARALNGRAGGDAARSTYSSALSSGTGSQADSATGVAGGPEDVAAHPEMDAWQAGFEAGQEAAAWAKLPSGSFDDDAQDFMAKSPTKVSVHLAKLHAEHLACYRTTADASAVIWSVPKCI
jgi:hypothetical protein